MDGDTTGAYVLQGRHEGHDWFDVFAFTTRERDKAFALLRAERRPDRQKGLRHRLIYRVETILDDEQ